MDTQPKLHSLLAIPAVNTVSFHGVPGTTFRIQRTTDLTAPVPWTTLSTQTAPPSGIIPRSQWAHIGVARQNDIIEMNGIRRITVHHDGMPPASLGAFRQVAGRIEQIRKSHVGGRGGAAPG